MAKLSNAPKHQVAPGTSIGYWTQKLSLSFSLSLSNVHTHTHIIYIYKYINIYLYINIYIYKYIYFSILFYSIILYAYIHTLFWRLLTGPVQKQLSFWHPGRQVYDLPGPNSCTGSRVISVFGCGEINVYRTREAT